MLEDRCLGSMSGLCLGLEDFMVNIQTGTVSENWMDRCPAAAHSVVSAMSGTIDVSVLSVVALCISPVCTSSKETRVPNYKPLGSTKVLWNNKARPKSCWLPEENRRHRVYFIRLFFHVIDWSEYIPLKKERNKHCLASFCVRCEYLR